MQRPSGRPLTARDLPADVIAWLPTGFVLCPLPEGDPANAALAEGSDDACVIKRGRGLPDSEWIAIEARALAALASTDLPIPRVIGIKPAHGDDDDAWLVTSRLPGQPLSRVLEHSDARTQSIWLARLGAMLAKIHGTPIPAALKNVDATPWERRRHEAPPRSHADRALASARLDGTPPPPRVLVHGDFTLDNVLVDDDAITGVIDWPGAGAGDPRFDVALALLSVPPHESTGPLDTATPFMTAYIEELARHHPELHRHVAPSINPSR